MLDKPIIDVKKAEAIDDRGSRRWEPPVPLKAGTEGWEPVPPTLDQRFEEWIYRLRLAV